MAFTIFFVSTCPYAYANNVKCAQFVGSIADCLKNEIVKSRYLAVMFHRHSTTDCSVQETEVVINLYVNLLLIIGNFKNSMIVSTLSL